MLPPITTTGPHINAAVSKPVLRIAAEEEAMIRDLPAG